ncbi:putative 50S ribosomal protein L9 [Candidatus Magnetomoraceae bacterium gMMP-1]
MDKSDFLFSMGIGAGTALIGFHLYEKIKVSKELKEMSLEDLIAQKERIEDFIAEYMANLQTNEKSTNN